MKTFVRAKIQDIVVTDKSLDYHGSISICPLLLAKAQIAVYEQVHVINLSNGHRWITYAIASALSGTFTLNGGGARLGEIGDRCVVLTYEQAQQFTGAHVIYCTSDNKVKEVLQYARA